MLKGLLGWEGRGTWRVAAASKALVPGVREKAGAETNGKRGGVMVILKVKGALC